MKKILALALSVLMILALVACGQPADTTTEAPESTTDPIETPDTPVNDNVIAPTVEDGTWGAAFWADFQTVVAANKGANAEAIMGALLEAESGKATSSMMVGTMPVDIEKPFEEFAHTGFTTFISGFKSASMLINMMMGGTPFLVYVFELDESANVREFVKLLSDTIDPNYMVCGTAETTTIGAVDNYAMTVLAPKEMPSALGGGSEVFAPELTAGSKAETLWNDFIAYMDINGSFSLAIDVADYLAGNEVVGAEATVEALDMSFELEGFKWAVEGYNNAASIKAGDVAIYVCQLDAGMMADSWGDYNFAMNAPEGTEIVWGAHGMTLILMMGVEA